MQNRKNSASYRNYIQRTDNMNDRVQVGTETRELAKVISTKFM